ncbi:MAG: transaldolase [Oligoflexales bacterium]|nr:transaldolase [Oligoflexales bacterium]
MDILPLKSLIESGTKLWVDSVDHEHVLLNKGFGATGATSNPIIISTILRSGKYDEEIRKLKLEHEKSSEEIAWTITDRLVTDAEECFLDIFKETNGDDGYVSFELDPFLEDSKTHLTTNERAEKYVELGKKWSNGHPNRLIKVPATSAGLSALGRLAEAGVNVNVTLIFTPSQYVKARNAIWEGLQKRKDLFSNYKSVYSIFVSRIDLYTSKYLPSLKPSSQGLVGIVNAKRIWRLNQNFWVDKKMPLKQEIVFASTGVKMPDDPPWKYVEAFAGSDIETNPPETNEATQKSGRIFKRNIDVLPSIKFLDDIDKNVHWNYMEKALMEEGIEKFITPQRILLKMIDEI